MFQRIKIISIFTKFLAIIFYVALNESNQHLLTACQLTLCWLPSTSHLIAPHHHCVKYLLLPHLQQELKTQRGTHSKQDGWNLSISLCHSQILHVCSSKREYMILLFQLGKIGLISLLPFIFCPPIIVIPEEHVSISLGTLFFQVCIPASLGIGSHCHSCY